MFKRTSWRGLIGLIILAVTLYAFYAYFISHPEVGRQLSRTSPLKIGVLLLLYIAFIGCLSLVNQASLRLCRSRISRQESLLLTMYSSIINFFGPLQSGPAFRAIYLKKKHAVKLRDYTLASFIYYFFYGLFSLILLLSGLLKWWLVPAVLILLLGLWQTKPVLNKFKPLELSQWPYMAAASLAQVSLLLLIFFIELGTVAPSVTLAQAAIYTGAANLALFVSITPGAIGFRESFLVFTQGLHDINNATIVSANILDRSVYIILLAMVAAFLFSTHARARLNRDLD
jgi:uncharacterized membrane protein YbhN (UPF0104 family)